jgi:hypothetical protein
MASSAMVPIAASSVHRPPSVISHVPNAFNEGQPASPYNQSATGSLETVSQRYEAADIFGVNSKHFVGSLEKEHLICLFISLE